MFFKKKEKNPLGKRINFTEEIWEKYRNEKTKKMTELLAEAHIKIRRIYDETPYEFEDEALRIILEKLENCEHNYDCTTDELIAEKADQLLRLFTNRVQFDIPRADAYTETILRLINQRQNEVGYKVSKIKEF
ncbi:MAG: hypothetical protein LBD41_00425 [Clostridiales Family XIII bacterium]|jgi:hypothetical protein|nr:hypothetical protein [Clostridiales Family XIII bacterium]